MSTLFTPSDPSDGARAERSHAARNRLLVLDAARRLFAERGSDCVTMEDVAREAGVGKGTVYRRFGDRAGLALALLDERDRELQCAILRGPPPLGPGAPAPERLVAFLRELVLIRESSLDLLLMAEATVAGGRFRSRIYVSYRLHTEVLLREVRPGSDTGFLADALLAPLAAHLFQHLREDRGMSTEQIVAGMAEMVCALTRSAPDAPG